MQLHKLRIFSTDTIKLNRIWCEMNPCLEEEECRLFNNSEGVIQGWECVLGDEVKSIKVSRSSRYL